MQRVIRAGRPGHCFLGIKLSWRAVTLAAFCVFPSLCSALGLSDIDYRSHLGEPFHAQIDIVGFPAKIDPKSVKIRLLDPLEAREKDVEILSTEHKFELELALADSGPHIQVRSARPIKEPYLNLFLELAWPAGKLYREYTLFLDPAESPKLRKTALVKEARRGKEKLDLAARMETENNKSLDVLAQVNMATLAERMRAKQEFQNSLNANKLVHQQVFSNSLPLVSTLHSVIFGQRLSTGTAKGSEASQFVGMRETLKYQAQMSWWLVVGIVLGIVFAKAKSTNVKKGRFRKIRRTNANTLACSKVSAYGMDLYVVEENLLDDEEYLNK